MMPRQNMLQPTKAFFCMGSLFAVLLVLSGCAGMDIEQGPSYKGRVIDRNTGQPLAGVVVVGHWTKTRAHLAGGTTYCVDARETVTDERGDFTIPNISFRDFNISIYKVGFERVECSWDAIDKVGSCYLKKSVQWIDGRAIFPLQEVHKSMLSRIGDPPFITCGRKDGKPLKEYNRIRREFRKAIGLKK